eukprot:scaffold1883_cov396-Prasinococcus_capsulatus_cf.AAC.33
MIKKLTRSSGRDGDIEVHGLVAEEDMLPLATASCDLVVSSLGLHWVNDLPLAMQECSRVLKEDGLFLAALFAEDTLSELRVSCTLAHEERLGGVASRVSPFVRAGELGTLMSAAGLRLTTIDVDPIKIRYPSAAHLVEHLRSMAESNALQARTSLSRDVAMATSAIYDAMFSSSEDDGGGVYATYQVVYLIGWKASKNQPKEAARGSATVSLKELDRLLSDRDTSSKGPDA